MPILPDSHLPQQNLADSGKAKNLVNPAVFSALLWHSLRFEVISSMEIHVVKFHDTTY